MSGELKAYCIHCGGGIEFPSELQGQKVVCPHCDAQIALPKTKNLIPLFVVIFVMVAIAIGGVVYFLNLPPSDRQGVASVMVLGGVGLVLMALYFTPSLIGFVRKKRNAAAILALNVLLGWTFLGWVVAFVWSLTNDD